MFLNLKRPFTWLIYYLPIYTNCSLMSLRQSDDRYRLHEPRAIGEKHLHSRSFSYSAPRLYNKLPITLKEIESVEDFKKKLKSHIFIKAYNSVDDSISQEYII